MIFKNFDTRTFIAPNCLLRLCKLGLQSPKLGRKLIHLPAAGTTGVPPACKDAGTLQQEMKLAMLDQQRSNLG